MLCSCNFNADNIIDDTFSCRASQEQFRNTVVYRAMITLQVPASMTDADYFVILLSDWVESKPSVRVNRITVELDPNCPTMLDSFDSNDCEASPDQTNPSPSAASSSSSSSSSVGIIIGAVIAAVVILLLITAIVIIIMYHRHKLSYRYEVNTYLATG